MVRRARPTEARWPQPRRGRVIVAGGPHDESVHDRLADTQGSLADHLGLHAAFAIEPVLIGACAILLLAGLRFGRRSPDAG
jgi:hypothetical protein